MKNENVLCIELAPLHKTFPLARQYWKTDAEALNALPFRFTPRRMAETDFTQKQLIPYALVFDEAGRMLTYQRHGSEGRLAGLRSAGIGGHVNEQDADRSLSATLTRGLIREMREELGLAPRPEHITLLGMINEDQSEVGRCHIGVVFRVEAGNHEGLRCSDEIARPEWRRAEELNLKRFELWSSLALRLERTINREPQ